VLRVPVPGKAKPAEKLDGLNPTHVWLIHHFGYCLAPVSSCKIQRRARRMAESFERFIAASCWRTGGDG
jgi:hypothetical protein